jgi:hypothetical protein
MSIKKVMYAIFFTNQGSAIQIVGKYANAKFYKGKVLNKLKKKYISKTVDQQLVFVVSGEVVA